MYLSSELSIEVAYYNETLAVWEPLIEPTLCDGVMKPWDVTAEVRMRFRGNWENFFVTCYFWVLYAVYDLPLCRL